MDQFFQELGLAFISMYYEANLPDGILNLFLMILLSVLVVWALAVVVMRLFLRQAGTDQDGYFRRGMHIRQGWYIAASGAGLIITALIVFLDFSDGIEAFRLNYPFTSRFGFLMMLISTFCIAILSLVSIRKQYDRDKWQEVMRMPLTRTQESHYFQIAWRFFQKIRWFILIPLLGFAIGLGFQKKEYNNLVAIVLDNSTSMQEPINRGKAALDDVLAGLDAKVEVVVTVLTPGNGYGDLQAITAIGSREALAGSPLHFGDQESAREYISQIEASNPDSPIAEAIWKTFLFSQEYINQGNEFYSQVLIIVSDGEVSLGNGDFFCSSQEFSDVFGLDNVFLIDVAGNGISPNSANTFFQEAYNCGYEVRQGTDLAQYSEGVQDALQGVKKGDWYWTIWAVIICIISILITVFINPRKLS